MAFSARDLDELRHERRLLLCVLALARRHDGTAPGPLLDAALAGTGCGGAGRHRALRAGRRTSTVRRGAVRR